MDAAVGKEFNLATGRETRIGDLALMINKLIGNQAGVQSATRRKWDNKSRRLASITRAREVLGYDPKIPVEVGLRNTIAWFMQNWGRIEASASFGPGASSAVREMVVNQDYKSVQAQNAFAAD